ncbi:MAG: four helix bundle protein [Candidatus Liptonbacteria bacterium RIFCSPLOWO2_01_FULL_52_25]|uniref:Four helix bundle protein n=1 Tax=Candidatus Liptonbacteria bacterium RIFCSPLOWO2_01_FULL_52_25 TaxID=1798650 RepID=A0A1G2CEL6_9BACT|nr:MAG: four helix bundle protein [Candidatus Liptonbacteria bacterium RIFCSPLOWO2_01_FULL_52_25]
MNQLSNPRYNLEERTAKFGENVIEFCKSVGQDAVSRPIISQLVRSATSIGANYCEANNASSKKDFRNKIFICKKECQETKHWLRMIAMCVSGQKEKIEALRQECQELTMIFQKIVSSSSERV